MKKISQNEPLMEKEENDTSVKQDTLTQEENLTVFKALKIVTKSSILPIIQYMLLPIVQVSNTLTLGHQDNSVQLLAAFGLGHMLVLISMQSLNLGLSNSLPTYISHAFANGDYKLCGIYRNRQVVINFTAITFTASLIIWSKPLLLLLGQTDEVAVLAKNYVLIQIPGQYFYGFLCCSQWFCFGQRQFLPPFLSQIAGVAYYFLFLIISLQLIENRLLVIALANCSANIISCLVMVALIKLKSAFQQTDQPFFDLETIRNIQPQAVFTFQALLMTMWNQWAIQVFVFLSAIIGETYVAAQAVLNSLIGYFLVIPMGIQTQTFVSSSFGKGNIDHAKAYIKATMIMGLIWGSFILIIIYVFKTQFLNMATSSTEIQEIINFIYPLFLITSFSQSVYGVAMNVIKGMGKQGFASIITFTSNWLIGIPISILAVSLNWSFQIFWVGVTTASVTKTLAFYAIIMLTDWNRIVEEFVQRRNLECNA